SDATYPVALTAEGKLRGVALKVKGGGGGLLRLVDESTPYPLRLEGSLGDSRAKVAGTVTGVGGPANLDADMTISGSNLAPLGDVLHLSLPATKPFSVAGRLERRGDDWRFRQVKGKVGASDLGGDFSVNIGGQRPMIEARLQSKNLDIADLGG